MPIKDVYSMSDGALAEMVGQRIDQIRLEQNLSQEDVATAVGITTKTYRKLIDGGGKLETLIAVLRVLGELELVAAFVPESTFSPLQLVKLKGRERQRASRKRTSLPADVEQAEDLDW
ncbi:MAG: helix-turn-helix transcriptional regulator [Desulfuromonadales bacterium]|nr:helix-turn-helix transcriptional regulator [Desulfuromonadales bacterium]